MTMKAAFQRESLEKDPSQLDPILAENDEHGIVERSFRASVGHILLSFILFILLSTFLVGIVVNIWAETLSPSNCAQRHSYYSPLNSLVNKDYQIHRFNNSDHRFRGPPSESVSEAWDQLTHIYPFSIPDRETVERIGADPDTSVVLPAEYGGGYEGILGITHQLHCLKTLWQYSYYDYYRTRDPLFALPAEDQHGHLDHCADLLRQSLLCQADLSVITFDWVKGHEWPQPHYGNPRECRNYADILKWAEENQAPVPPGNKVEKPDGAMERDMSG